ncbi:hypothetical protein PN499_04980 [Kamptonema animale CS-326]|jgi:hypothetical protein|uniref:hypothetical protein n=1 Tax=Kamptonema animale TaxID=92934 RepID=UPI00232AB1C4|nr:hypothetical protein [Kamptonema animale]MDB9510531.1 hypothetical protein [Kamptonema animale CS-326]
MKAKIYDQIQTLIEIPDESSDFLIPKGTVGGIVECYENPEVYAVDLAIPNEKFVGGFAYINIILEPEQFEVIIHLPAKVEARMKILSLIPTRLKL